MTERQTFGPISVVIDDKALARRLARYKPSIARLGRPIVTDMIRQVETDAIRGMRPFAGNRNPPRQPIQVRSGQLRSSINVHIKGQTIKGATGTITAGNRQVRYSRVQEFGGTIRPATARYLRVPLASNLLPSGEPKPGNEIVRANRFGKTSRRGRSWGTADGDPTFVRDGLIYAKRPDGSVEPIHKLVKKVSLSPRRYILGPLYRFAQGSEPKKIIMRHLDRVLKERGV